MSVPTPVADFIKSLASKTDIDAKLAKAVKQVVDIPACEADISHRVRTVLLEDDKGRVQVAFPENTLLDLDVLNRLLQRKLASLAKEDLEEIQLRNKWTTPILPDLAGSEAVSDTRLLSFETITLPSQGEDRYLQMDRCLLDNLIGQTKIYDFCVPLSDVLVNRHEPSQDLYQINQAIGSFTKCRICKRLEDTLEMPPLPETAQRIIKLRVDPDAGIAQLADLVEMDPSLSAQVVSWASSSFYAAPGKIRSVHDAIVRVLGFDLVMNLAMGLALGKMLEIPKDGPDGVKSYWEQAVWMATLCGGLATSMPKETRPEFGLTYLSGLLHNFGFLVLAHVFPPHFLLINRYAEVNSHIDVEVCEQHLLGITREQIGSQLMFTWNMPEEVVSAIRHQKNPEYDGDHSVYSALIYIATQFMRERKISHGPVQPIPKHLWTQLGITDESSRQVFEELLDMSDEMSNLAGNLESAIAS